MENREVLLKVENLCQYFRMGRHVNKAVDNVSFEIYRGEVFGLVGESGCGKTTTGRSIIKLYDITSGDVYFKGRRICAGIQSYKNAISLARKDAREKIQNLNNDSKLNPENKSANDGRIKVIKSQLNEIVKNNKTLIDLCKIDQKYCDKLYAKDLVKELEEEYKNKPKDDEYYKSLKIAKKARLVTQIQMIFQDPIASLNPRMTVQEIIAEGLIIKGITDKKYIQEKVYEILELVGLVKEHATRYPHEFSGGQKQRIGIARAIIMQPDMIIADEPVSALDVSIQAQVINLLNELREKLGLTILFIAHDLSVVKYFSDRIGVMYYGKLVELASSDELFAHPIHPYTRSLLSAIPLPDPVYEKKRVRMVYNPIAEHDYRYDKPTFREIRPNHFVYCNDAEEAKYKEQF